MRQKFQNKIFAKIVINIRECKGNFLLVWCEKSRSARNFPIPCTIDQIDPKLFQSWLKKSVQKSVNKSYKISVKISVKKSFKKICQKIFQKWPGMQFYFTSRRVELRLKMGKNCEYFNFSIFLGQLQFGCHTR